MQAIHECKAKAVTAQVTVTMPPAPPAGFRYTQFVIETPRHKSIEFRVDHVTGEVFSDVVRQWVLEGIGVSTLSIVAEHFDGSASVEMSSKYDTAADKWLPWLAW